MQKENHKIGLLSCHDDPNYGSMLQAYALAEAIRKCGRESEYLSYKEYPTPYSWTAQARKLVKKTLKLCGLYQEQDVWSFLQTAEFAPLMAAFQRFHEQYIPHSSQIYYSDTVRQELNIHTYDNFIVGSDQSWSPLLYNPKKPYFLDFAPIRRKQAYAPSLGTSQFSDAYKQLLQEKLSSFEHLSCRERINADMLTELLGRKVQHVLDPTLLLERSDWDKVATSPNIERPYILAYILGEKEAVASFAEKLGARKNLPVYYILTRPKYLSQKNLIADAGPDDFVCLIKHAEYIVTDSYHGCLFSINYNKAFYAFGKKEGGINADDNIRILEFLETVGLTSRFLEDHSDCKDTAIDYTEVNTILTGLRQSSLKYLQAIL